MSSSFRINDEKLVKLIQKYPCLYDPKNDKYKDLFVRNRSWQIIADMLNSPVNLCKYRWKNIRDSYNRRKRNVRRGRRRPEHSRKWDLEDLLDFLSTIEVPPIGSLCGTNDDNKLYTSSDDDRSQDRIESISIKPEDVKNDSQTLIANCITEQQSDKETEPTMETTMKLTIPSSPVSTTLNRQQDDTTNHRNNHIDERQILLSEIINEKISYDEHPVDIFFRSMATAVRKLTEERQIRAKIEVCQVVGQLELEQLIARSSLNK